MPNTSISLTPDEMSVLRKAVKTCVDKCQQGGVDQGCEDCQTLEAILQKLKNQ